MEDTSLRLWCLEDGLDWTPAELKHLADFTKSLQPQPRRVAIVSGPDLGFGLMRVFQAYRADPDGPDVRVFRDEASARAFLLHPDPYPP